MQFASLLALAVLPLAAAAQVPAAPDSVATPRPLTYYAYVDGYYGYDFGHANGNERQPFLYSHSRQNEFSVNQALLGVRYDNGRVRGTVALHSGSYPAANYANEDPTLRHLYEAYAGFRPCAKAWLDVGVFSSHIGFESALSKDSWTLTRSLSAENSPYYEAGARLTYEVGPKLTLTALVLNGWQNIRETNQGKGLGTQLQWKPTAKLLLNSSTFYGNEQPTGLAIRRRYFHDFYLSYAATNRVKLALVFDVGKQQRETAGQYDTWHTAAAFLQYKLAERVSTTLRGEYYYAERGVIIKDITPVATNANFRVAGGSLNLDYAPATNVLVRLEGRYLNGATGVFARADNPLNHSYGNLTSSIALSF